MKKAFLIFMVIALIGACAFTFFACKDAAVGDYKFVSATIAGATVTSMQVRSDAVMIKLNDDKTYTFTFEIGAFSVAESGTWEQTDGTTITFTNKSGALSTATISDDTMTLEYNSHMTFVFSK